MLDHCDGSIEYFKGGNPDMGFNFSVKMCLNSRVGEEYFNV